MTLADFSSEKTKNQGAKKPHGGVRLLAARPFGSPGLNAARLLVLKRGAEGRLQAQAARGESAGGAGWRSMAFPSHGLWLSRLFWDPMLVGR